MSRSASAYSYKLSVSMPFYTSYSTTLTKPRPVSTIKYPQQNPLQTPNFYTNWYKYA
jgi:hypothetical protein